MTLRRIARACAAALVLVLAGCSTVTGLTQLDDMTAPELERYAARLSVQVEAVTATAVAEGDITPEVALAVADALQGLSAGSVASAVGALDLQGYGGLALALTLSEIDAQLEARGALGGEEWSAVMRAVADGVRRGVGP